MCATQTKTNIFVNFWASLSQNWKFRLRALLSCEESNFSNYKFEYIRKNEFLRETFLTCLLGVQKGWINEIK